MLKFPSFIKKLKTGISYLMVKAFLSRAPIYAHTHTISSTVH